MRSGGQKSLPIDRRRADITTGDGKSKPAAILMAFRRRKKGRIGAIGDSLIILDLAVEKVHTTVCFSIETHFTKRFLNYALTVLSDAPEPAQK